VAQGLAATFDVLAKTGNTTAVRVLLPALDYVNPTIQDGALEALLKRHDAAGHREILARISNLPHRWKKIIQKHSDRLTGALRTVLVDTDESLCLNACRTALMFQDYNVIPALLAATEIGSQAKSDMAAETLLQLTLQLHADIERYNGQEQDNDPEWSRRHVLASLETSVQRFGHHKRREVMEAFLLLADRENKVLNLVLHNPHHVCFLIMADVLSKTEQSCILRLLLSFLDDPHPPAAVLNIISNRSDPKFVRYLLRHVGMELSATVRHNFKRIRNFAWLRRSGMIDYLDNSGQYGLVQLVMAAGISRELAFETIKHLLLQGKLAGRREAAKALATFNGSDANALVLTALEDSDSQVQANILAHIRQRAIPGILPRLVTFMENPHHEVRRAAQRCLGEYTFARFVSSFDMLDDDVQKSTGELVKKVDPETLPLLQKELTSKNRSWRIKGLKIAVVLDLVDALEATILDLLHDGDPEVRCEAARTLAASKSPTSRQALEYAQHDNDYHVQLSAKRSLQERDEEIIDVG
jgi:HEAT repeat protein